MGVKAVNNPGRHVENRQEARIATLNLPAVLSVPEVAAALRSPKQRKQRRSVSALCRLASPLGFSSREYHPTKSFEIQEDSFVQDAFVLDQKGDQQGSRIQGILFADSSRCFFCKLQSL